MYSSARSFQIDAYTVSLIRSMHFEKILTDLSCAHKLTNPYDGLVKHWQ